MTDERWEQATRDFHEAYERLAPSFGYETRRDSAVPWDDVPEQNKALMRAVVAEVVGPLERELADVREEKDWYRREKDLHLRRLLRAEAQRDAAREVVEAARRHKCMKQAYRESEGEFYTQVGDDEELRTALSHYDEVTKLPMMTGKWPAKAGEATVELNDDEEER